MLEILKRELDVKAFGNVYKLNYPSAKRMNQFMLDVKKMVSGELDKSDYELSSDLVVECGLPREIVDQLPSEDLREVIKTLDGQKKI